MPTFVRLISQYFWLIALGFCAFNYVKAKKDFLKSHAAQPTTAAEGEPYLKRLAVGSALPWVVMGVGQVAGFTPTVWHYFRPQDGNPFVLAWLAVCFAGTCLYAWWVLAAGGAQKVRDLNLMAVLGQHTGKPPSLFSIKALAAIGPLIFPVWIYMTVTQNIPLPG